MTKKTQPKISIIVPVYNVQKYIDRCIESILSQTFKEIELILVDDGSPDNSGKICDEYAKNDDRVKVLHKQNEGVSVARRDGVYMASGDYIAFVDSDDFLSTDYCEKLYTQMIDNQLDLVECNLYEYSNGKSSAVADRSYSNKVIENQKDFLNTVYRLSIIEGTEPSFLWNKLYIKSIIIDNNIDFGTAPNEDYYFNMQYYTFVNRYMFINEPLYYYRNTPNSFSRRNNDNTFDLLLAVEEKKQSCMQKLHLTDEKSLLLSYKWFLKYTEDIVRMLFKFKSQYGFFKKIKRTKFLMTNDIVVNYANAIQKSDYKNIFAFCVIHKIYALCPVLLFSKTIFRRIVHR